MREKGEKDYLSSVANYVASALTPEDEHPTLDNKTKREILANYDVVGTTTNIKDEEATELMRTLCAHLLPFGVDRNSIREESTPVWDEENPNEPGYRIIRLTKSQLRRVERAFDAMITRLKHNSHSSLNGLEGQFDENFIRELEEAERLLDDEEERKIKEKTEETASVNVAPKLQLSASVETTDEDERAAGVSHPEFPGVKSAGKGEMGDLEYFQLPIIFKSKVTGFEPTKDMALEPGNIIAGQYLVESELGSAAFSTAYRCVDLSSEDNDGHEEVCLKVIKNTKDFFDQSLDEIKILELLRQTGKCDENYILRVKTFFYYREHLIIVTELLRQNLFEFGKFILDNDEEPYFTLPRLAFITRQCLISLRFVHNLGLVHSDVKPENILLGSYSRAQIKLIDFGSSCYLTDRQSSYIQSRSYRAPEVVLGLPYDGKIDVWSLGCVVAEMFTGDVTFQNDSIVSMLSRIEAFRGSFPRHMIAQGRECGRFFTKSGLLYEVVGQSDEEGPSITPPAPDDEESDCDTEVEFDIFQPKNTQLSSRLGFDADLMDDYGEKDIPMERKIEQMFTDFVAKLLTIDPDGRPSADEALNHPYMLYAASLTDEQIKYPSS
jgi:serine/threonine protein kinase